MMQVWDDDVKTPSERFDEAVNKGNDKRITVMIPVSRIWRWLTGRYKKPDISDRPMSREEVLKRYGSGNDNTTPQREDV